MLYKATFITALITIIVLEKCDEVRSFKHDWEVRIFVGIPITIFFGDVHIPCHVVLVLEDFLEHVNQVIQVSDQFWSIFLFTIFSNCYVPFIKFKKGTLPSKQQGNGVGLATDRDNSLLEIHFHIDVLPNQPLALDLLTIFIKEMSYILTLRGIKLKYNQLSVGNCQQLGIVDNQDFFGVFDRNDLFELNTMVFTKVTPVK